MPPFTIVVGPVFSDTFAPERSAGIAFQSYGVIGNARALAKTRQLDVIPSNYSAFCADFADGRHRADVVLVQLAEDENGRLSASLSNDYVMDAARRARVVIAEINPDAPWTFGAEWPADIVPHRRIAATRPPLELPSAKLDDVSRRIAEHAASLIPDGSTLQFGIGKFPDAILSSLSHVRDLGIHSGLINDAVVDLIECGAVTNAGKGIDPGVTIANQLIGTQRLYRFVHQNQAVSVRPASYTHAQRVLARDQPVGGDQFGAGSRPRRQRQRGDAERHGRWRHRRAARFRARRQCGARRPGDHRTAGDRAEGRQPHRGPG